MTACWYPDPTGRHAQRYWDGSTWTAHVADGGTRTSDPPGDDCITRPEMSDPRSLDHKVFEGFVRYADLVALGDPLDIRTLADVLDTIRTPLTGAVGDGRVNLALVVNLVLGGRRPPALMTVMPGRMIVAWSAGGSQLLPTINVFAASSTCFGILDDLPRVRGLPVLTATTAAERGAELRICLPPETRPVADHFLAQITGTP